MIRGSLLGAACLCLALSAGTKAGAQEYSYYIEAFTVSPTNGTTYHTGSQMSYSASVGFYSTHEVRVWADPFTSLAIDWLYEIGYEGGTVKSQYGPGGNITTNELGFWSNSDSLSKSQNITVGNHMANSATTIFLPDSPWFDTAYGQYREFTVVRP